VRYSQEVSTTTFISDMTLNTRTRTSTNSTLLFYEEESETDDEISVSNTTPYSNVTVEQPVESSISTVAAEISELDKIDFDEVLVLDESVDL
jgi:hypothetical protein